MEREFRKQETKRRRELERMRERALKGKGKSENMVAKATISSKSSPTSAGADVPADRKLSAKEEKTGKLWNLIYFIIT